MRPISDMTEAARSLGEQFLHGPVGLAAGLAGVVALLFFGASPGSVLELAVLLGVAAIFGVTHVLLASAVLSGFLRAMPEVFQKLTEIWLAGPAHEKFFTFVQETGFIDLTIMFFFAGWAIAFTIDTVVEVLGSFRAR